jgi:RNA polymerase sigma factor (sigma-70 family)
VARRDLPRLSPSPTLSPARDLERDLSGETDAKLLELTPKSERAFLVFYRRHMHDILVFLLSRTGNDGVAEELACETFASAYMSVKSYDPKRGDGRAWLFGIAKITLLRSYRQHAIEQSARHKLGMSIGNPSHEAWERAERRLDSSYPGLQEALGKLTDHERTAVEARVVHERDYAEIALAENTSEAAVRKRVSRGLQKLADTITRRPH